MTIICFKRESDNAFSHIEILMDLFRPELL